MPAYKDDKTKKWFASFYVKIQGKSKKIKKMGFTKKKEAEEYERNYLNSFIENTEITFKNLYFSYMEDSKNRLRLHTIENKKNILKTKILPFFETYKIKDISPLIIRKWQNEIINKGYSETYLKTINNQLVALLNYAVKFYNLDKNPCLIAGSIGKKNAEEMHVWTIQEFKTFIALLEHKSFSYVGFTILFYTGIRIGELLALTVGDIDFKNHKIRINKSYQRIAGQDVITAPKTPKSKRIIDCPEFVIEIIDEFIKKIYKPNSKTRLFEGTTKHRFEHDIKTYSEKAKLKRIRVHDLRHSHATFLLSKGVNIVSLSRRLGHEKVSTTLDIYSHALKEDNDLIKKILNNL